MKARFDSIESVIADVRKGRMVIVVDDADRENEGDLIMAAQFVTPETVNFMAKHGRGLICVPTTSDRFASPFGCLSLFDRSRSAAELIAPQETTTKFAEYVSFWPSRTT